MKNLDCRRFDAYAYEYDTWFIENRNIFETELRLVAETLKESHRILSIGCGSCIFEKALRDEYDIEISRGIEPSQAMADIAAKRGFNIEVCSGEDAEYGILEYDTILFNGCPCYMNDLRLALRKSWGALVPEGKVIVIDVPKESSFGTIYNLAMTLGNWNHPLLADTKPKDEYPIELVISASWRTTEEKTQDLLSAGFSQIQYKQTLTANPKYAHLAIEDPIDGYDKGSYVAIIGKKMA